MEFTKTMKVPIYHEIEIPQVPNFFRLKDGNDKTISISEISDHNLGEIGALWTEKLKLRALEIRKYNQGKKIKHNQEKKIKHNQGKKINR